MNATRFALPPLPQPSYHFGDVPHGQRDLKGSVLQYCTDRRAWQTCMAEMLLLCKEAVRRRRRRKKDNDNAIVKKSGSKPLSLEYLADRFDVDDPLWGYLVRHEGRLQGFISVTTFTNYHPTFKWDSLHEEAWTADEDDMIAQREAGLRRVDDDGTLARALQRTVRCGDIWKEGLVWPRVAEISLLGGLGCGRTLVELAIERLEREPPTPSANYDFVVLQATDNSIPFYESLGFVRVGAVVHETEGGRHAPQRHSNAAQNNNDNAPLSSSSSSSSCSSSNSSTASAASSQDAAVAEPLPPDSPEQVSTMATPHHLTTSKLTHYKCKPGETVRDVAKKLGVDALDIVFLNQYQFPQLVPSSKLMGGTFLHIPDHAAYDKDGPTKATRSTEANKIQWYTAKENDTPRTIAKQFGVPCLDLVEANKGRLQGLISSSRLKEGTRVKVSNLDQKEVQFKPYAHWAFPDDDFDDGEPSYMMARRLNRDSKRGKMQGPVEQGLAVSVTEYEPTTLMLPASPVKQSDAAALHASHALSVTREEDFAALHVAAVAPSSESQPLSVPKPKRPKRTLGPFQLFQQDYRKKYPDVVAGLSFGEIARTVGAAWQAASAEERAPYEAQARELRESYHQAQQEYRQALQEYEANAPPPKPYASVPSGPPPSAFYNAVVRLKPGALTEGFEYMYWYVLTFIPDLKWCHLAPMVQVGVFGADKPKAQGRPKYKLVDESLGQEVDISSRFCIPIKSKSMKRTTDADKEEWDIIDDGTWPEASVSRRYSVPSSISTDIAMSSTGGCATPQPVLTSTAIKASTVVVKRSRKRPRSASPVPSVTHYDMPLLTAVRPDNGRSLSLRILLKTPVPTAPSPKRGRGRPKGSKNRPKSPPPPVAAVPSLSLSSSCSKGSKSRPKVPPAAASATPYRVREHPLRERSGLSQSSQRAPAV